jgi:uncharacterized protein
MTGAVDAPVLLYASDSSHPLHEQAFEFLRGRAAGPDLFYIFWPTIMSYLRLATHPAVFRDPIEPDVAMGNIERLLALPHVRTGSETDRFWMMWRATTHGIPLRGNLVADAHIVTLMREHGVRVIYSRDRDLRKFDGIQVVDPFDIGSAHTHKESSP